MNRTADACMHTCMRGIAVRREPEEIPISYTVILSNIAQKGFQGSSHSYLAAVILHDFRRRNLVSSRFDPTEAVPSHDGHYDCDKHGACKTGPGVV